MIRLTTLGSLELGDAETGRRVGEVQAQPKRLALLVYLALAGGRPVRRDTLLGMFWPERPDTRARRALNQTLYILRQHLGDAIQSDGTEDVRLDAASVWCDAVEFESLTERGELDAALQLYAGRFLPGFHVPDCAEFEQWLTRQRDLLQRRACDAACALSLAEVRRDNPSGALSWMRRATEIMPLDEPVQRELLRMLVAAGDHSGARRELDAFRKRLREALDLEPDAETVAAATPAFGAPTTRANGTATPSSAQRPPEPHVGRNRAALTWLRAHPSWVLASAVFGAVFVLVAFRLAARPVPDPTRVAVLPFTVEGDARFSYLSEGIVDLLAVKLDVPGYLHTADPRAVLSAVGRPATRDPEVGRSVANRLGASHFIVGSVLEAGGALEFSAALHDRDGSRLATASVSAADESHVLAAIDDLSRTMLAERVGAPLMRTAAATTASLPALKAFLDGERALRRGDYSEAVASFESATQLDTAFALAFYRLAVSADWAGRTPLSNASLNQAWSARGRLPERERLLVGARRLAPGDAAAAERELRTLLTRYPRDAEGLEQLAELLFHRAELGGSIAEIRAAFAGALEYDPDNATLLLHLARLAAFDGALADLDSLIDRTALRETRGLGALELRALRAFSRRDEAARRAVRAEFARLDDQTLEWMTFRTAAYSGALSDVRSLAALLTDSRRATTTRAMGHVLWAHLEAAGGRLRAADTQLARAAALDRAMAFAGAAMVAIAPDLAVDSAALRAARDSLATIPDDYATSDSVATRGLALTKPAFRRLLLGILSARIGDTATAWTQVRRMEQLREGPAWSAAVRAELAMHDGLGARPLDDATLLLDRMTATSTGIELYQRAQLLQRLNRDSDALRWHAAMTADLNWPFLMMPGNVVARARIRERRGDVGVARKLYSRLADWRRGADADQQASLTEAMEHLGSDRVP